MSGALTNGIRRCSPGVSVLTYFPKRSITKAVRSGTILQHMKPTWSMELYKKARYTHDSVHHRRILPHTTTPAPRHNCMTAVKATHLRP